MVHPMMKEIGGLITQPLDWNRFFDLTDSVGLVQARIDRAAPTTSGIADVDKSRAEVRVHPTDASNVLSRRIALYRWWRLLWRQGINMDPFDAVANELLKNGDDTAEGRQAITDGFAALEALAANPEQIPELAGSPGESSTRTDWPVYMGARCRFARIKSCTA